jgi:hypothetical protein
MVVVSQHQLGQDGERRLVLRTHGRGGQVKAEEESKILPGIFLNRQRVANGSAHITSSSEERRG